MVGEALGRERRVVDAGGFGEVALAQQAPLGGLGVDAEGLEPRYSFRRQVWQQRPVVGLGQGQGPGPGLRAQGLAEAQGELGVRIEAGDLAVAQAVRFGRLQRGGEGLGLQRLQARVLVPSVLRVGAEGLGQVGGRQQGGAGRLGVERLRRLAPGVRAVGEALSGQMLVHAGQGQAQWTEGVAAGGRDGVCAEA